MPRSNPTPTPPAPRHVAVLKPAFEPYEKVLVREGPGEPWLPALYGKQAGALHAVIMADKLFREVLPYEGNEDIAFTDIDPTAPSMFTGAQIVAVTDLEDSFPDRMWKIRLYKHRDVSGLHVTEDPDTGKIET